MDNDTKPKNKPVQRKTKSKELRCFIIMPFSKAEFEDSDGNVIILNQRKLKHIYEKLLKRSVKEYNKKSTKFISIKRYERTRGNFVKGIINDLDQADLVIADLTGLNTNVFYELGIRHTLKVGTIMLTQDIKSLPADLKSYVAFEYKYHKDAESFDEYYPEFKKKLHKAIDEYIEDYPKGEYDNPVRDFIGSRNIFKDEQRIKEINGNINIMKIVINEHIDNIIDLGSDIEKWATGERILFTYLNDSIKSFMNRLIMLNENVEIIKYIRDYILNFNIIEGNMTAVRNVVQKAKDTNACLEIAFSFRDMSGKRYHILDLYEYYKDSNTRRTCPINEVFYKFINDWEIELESLTS